MVSHLFAFAYHLRSLRKVISPFWFLIFPFPSLVYYLRNFAKFRRYVFLTSLNIAQKVKKYKTLTSVKKNLRCLTYFFGKQREFFLLKKKKVFLQRKNFLLKRKKILLQRKFSGGRSQKKGGLRCPPLTLCKYTSFFGDLQICISRYFYKS